MIVLLFYLYTLNIVATTGSTFDAVAEELKSWRWVPSLRFIGGYYENELYIKALKNSIEEFWTKNSKPKKIVFSYHGVPKKYLDKGDPYHFFVEKRLG